MILSRKWLNEFVDVSDISDREFDEAMTLSGSKVETVTALDESLKNVVVGKILSMEKHPDSDHMWICQIDVGQAEPTQIVTGAWNIHVGDLVPVAQHKSLLPNGTKIEKGKLRGVVSNGMLCSLKELSLTAEHDYPYAVITPAALLNDYKPLDPEKPSIPADIKSGDKVFGPVVCGKVLECEAQSYGQYHTTLDIGGATASPDTACSNLHAGDLVAYNTKTDSICTLEDLHAEQKEFPHCIADGIFVLNEDVKPGDDMAKVIGADDHVVEFEITPNRPDCLSVIGLAREASATFGRPLKLHTPEVKGCGGSIAELVDIDIEDGDLCPRYTARMVKNVKIQPSPAWMRERLRNSGVRPINNIVDITNYVMLEYGQPMHAFDFSCVEGNHIIVRTAREGETIQTLDGNQRKLTPSMLCICDENKPVCVAGVMGGANSEIVGDTAMVLFESANFNGTSIHRTAAALKAGESLTFSPTVLPAAASDMTLQWTSSDASVVRVEDGVVTALRSGSATVTAASPNGKKASCKITVTAAGVESVALNYRTVLLDAGKTFRLTATVTPADAEDAEVAWTSSDTSVVRVENGVVTAVGAGKAVVTASTANGKSASCQLEVRGASSSSLKLSSKELSLTAGNSALLTANAAVSWSSSDPSVAAVTSGGRVEAKKPGSAAISSSILGL